MEDSQKTVIEAVEQDVKKRFEGEGTGHDWHHIDRVRKIALRIAKEENADLYITELGALLHDIADHKFFEGDLERGPLQAEMILREHSADSATIDAVKEIISEVSYKGAGVETPVSSKESACVQDADRIDALGAIGIGRTFAYGGFVGNSMHEPKLKPEMHDDFKEYSSANGSTINHFYEKLLLLKDRMNTAEGEKIAVSRHEFMEQYLDRFFKEWEGDC
ncbi:HD domain-containing protein [Halocola ammonii]